MPIFYHCDLSSKDCIYSRPRLKQDFASLLHLNISSSDHTLKRTSKLTRNKTTGVNWLIMSGHLELSTRFHMLPLIYVNTINTGLRMLNNLAWLSFSTYGWIRILHFRVPALLGALSACIDSLTLEMNKCADKEKVGGGGGGGGRGSRPPPPHEKSQNIGFLSITGPNPLKKHKATKPAFTVWPSSARQRNAILMAFRWRADDGPL